MLHKLQPYPSRLELQSAPTDSQPATFLFYPGEWPDMLCGTESEFLSANYLNLDPTIN